MANNFKSQSAEAVNSAVATINGYKINNYEMGFLVYTNVEMMIDKMVDFWKKHYSTCIDVNNYRFAIEGKEDLWWVNLYDVSKGATHHDFVAGVQLGKIKRGVKSAITHLLYNYVSATSVKVYAYTSLNNDFSFFGMTNEEIINHINNVTPMLNNDTNEEMVVEEQVENDTPMLDIDDENERFANDLVVRANGTMGDYFTDVTKNMWDFSRDDIDEDRVREILLEKVDGLVDVEFREPDDDDYIVRVWFDRPIKEKKQEQDDELGTGAIEMFNSYMRERVSEEFESLVDALKDSADEFSGEEVFAEFDYEFDYEQEWLDYITNMDDINVTSEYALAFYKENIEDFVNVDDIQEYIYSIEEGCGVRTDDHGLECCNVYVENPYYVSDKMRAYRIAKVVNDNWVKNAVEDYVKLDWSLFNEQDMELMFSDSDFAKMVYDRVCERNKYFSECLAYDDCFYVWLTENVGCVLVDYIYDLDSRPAWVDRNNFDFKDCGDHLEIIMFGSYKIGLYYDPSDSSADFACAENGAAYGKRDMEYAVEIMDNRDMILALAEKARIVKPIAEEQEEFNKVA